MVKAGEKTQQCWGGGVYLKVSILFAMMMMMMMMMMMIMVMTTTMLVVVAMVMMMVTAVASTTAMTKMETLVILVKYLPAADDSSFVPFGTSIVGLCYAAKRSSSPVVHTQHQVKVKGSAFKSDCCYFQASADGSRWPQDWIWWQGKSRFADLSIAGCFWLVLFESATIVSHKVGVSHVDGRLL